MMASRTLKKICRLCLAVGETEFIEIDEKLHEMINVLLLEIDMNIIDAPVICRNCVAIIEKSFNFKFTWVHTEKRIASFAIKRGQIQFTFKEVLQNNKSRKPIIAGNYITCRFCMNHLEVDNFMSMKILIKGSQYVDMLPAFLPEMDFSIVENPVICDCCKDNLDRYLTFIMNSLGVERIINAYCQDGNINCGSRINSANLLRFLSKGNSGQPPKSKEVELNISEELGNVYPIELIKVEEIMHVKDEDILSENLCKRPTDISLGPNRNEKGCKMTQKLIKSRKLTRKVADKVNSRVGSYKCTLCTYETKVKGNFKRHALIHKSASEIVMNKCVLCTYETKYKDQLKRHMLTHSISVTNMCRCTFCAYQTKLRDTLEKHMRTHKCASDIQTYKCFHCSYETNRKDLLKNHLPIHSNVELKTYKCSKCSYETRYRHSIKIHMVIHKDASEVEMYQCTLCTFETKWKNYIKRHIRTHGNVEKMGITSPTRCTRDVKPKERARNIPKGQTFKCAMCMFEVRSKSSLKRHMLIHRHVPDAEMYRCQHCPYESSRKDLLKRHMLMHNSMSYKCIECSFGTKYKHSLKLHALNHKDASEIEMLKCMHCTYEAKHKKNLKSHMLTHRRAMDIETKST